MESTPPNSPMNMDPTTPHATSAAHPPSQDDSPIIFLPSSSPPQTPENTRSSQQQAERQQRQMTSPDDRRPRAQNRLPLNIPMPNFDLPGPSSIRAPLPLPLAAPSVLPQAPFAPIMPRMEVHPDGSRTLHIADGSSIHIPAPTVVLPSLPPLPQLLAPVPVPQRAYKSSYHIHVTYVLFFRYCPCVE